MKDIKDKIQKSGGGKGDMMLHYDNYYDNNHGFGGGRYKSR